MHHNFSTKDSLNNSDIKGIKLIGPKIYRA